ncbi:hypothetical protein ABPG75_011363 [Micractinium tetrahymenae]
MSELDLARPAEAVPLTEDGLLHLLTLREGEGDVPPKHARCLVHFVGRLAETGEVFMDTRLESQTEEPQVVVAGRHAATQETGLSLVVERMRCGARARVWAAPEYGYGARGSFSFPTVPPNAHLVYDVELLDFEAANEGKERGMMTFEERLEAAERRRADGNAAFSAGQYAEALGKYRLALSYLNEDVLMQLGDFHFHKAMALKRPVQLNIAACQLKQEDYPGAITTCSEVLADDPKNPKALFRRGRARHELGQLEAAAEDLEAAKAAAPGDGGVARELAAVRAKLREEQRASGKLFKGYFGKSKEQLYEDAAPAAAAAAAAAAPTAAAADSGHRGSQQQQQHDQGSGLLQSLACPAAVVAAAVAGVALLLPLLGRWLQPGGGGRQPVEAHS